MSTVLSGSGAEGDQMLGSDGDLGVLYCICKRPYDTEAKEFMIECEICKDWFHGSCVGIQEYQASEIETYHCPSCQIIHGPLQLKKRRNILRPDYSDDNFGLRIKTGTVSFLHELKSRTFASMDEMPLCHLSTGHDLSRSYVEEHGFNVPILVDRKDGLQMKIPNTSFSINDVENCVGSMRELDVIDVEKQEDFKMLMREWTDYYSNAKRTKILNVISLEFSNTKLADFVDPPRLVRDLSWANIYWPSLSTGGPGEPTSTLAYLRGIGEGLPRPEVHRYCLMSVKDCFTDFHIDFGGTSVWYHILKGEKVFYMIQPTTSNLTLYERWLSSSNQNEMFFGDQVDACYKFVIRQGQTVFIPSGWIHAVYTPVDSLVFGGNFLTNYNIGMQLKVYEMEQRVKTPHKYRFPSYEPLNWFAAQSILDTLSDYRVSSVAPPQYLISGAKDLYAALKSWASKKSPNHHDPVPDGIQHKVLLKEFQTELKHILDSPLKKRVPPLIFSAKNLSLHPAATERHRLTTKSASFTLKKKKKRNISQAASSDNKIMCHRGFAQGVGGSRGKEGGGGTGGKGAWVDGLGIAEGDFKISSPGDKAGEEKLISRHYVEGVGKREERKVTYQSNSFSSEAQQKRGEYMVGGRESSGANWREGGQVSGINLNVKFGVKKSDLSSLPQDTKALSIVKDERLTTQQPDVAGSGCMGGGPLGGGHLGGGEVSNRLDDVDLNEYMSSSYMSGPAEMRMKESQSVDNWLSDNSLRAFHQDHMYTRSFGSPPPIRNRQQYHNQLTSPNVSLLHDMESSCDMMTSQDLDYVNEEEVDDDDDDDRRLVVDESAQRARTTAATIAPVLHKIQPKSHISSCSQSPVKRDITSPTQSSTPVKRRKKKRSSSISLIGGGDGRVRGLLLGGSPPQPHVDYMSRLTMPVLRGGLNSNITDVLQVTGYGTETDIKVDDDFGRASPTMRDAIQGMLSMSRMGQSQSEVTSDELELQMKTCYKDDEYKEDISDRRRKHRGGVKIKRHKDDAWNPKGKSVVSMAAMPGVVIQRSQRPAARKESVASGLAAAAAKLSNQSLVKKKKKFNVNKSVMSVPSEDHCTGGHVGGLASTPVTAPQWDLEEPYDLLANQSTGRVMSSSLSPPLNRYTSGGGTDSLIKSPVKKPRKGEATAKQRLSKILKMHKMLH